MGLKRKRRVEKERWKRAEWWPRVLRDALAYHSPPLRICSCALLPLFLSIQEAGGGVAAVTGMTMGKGEEAFGAPLQVPSGLGPALLFCKHFLNSCVVKQSGQIGNKLDFGPH